MTEQKTTPRTWWHRLLGVLLKELLVPLGITVEVDFPVMSKSPEVDVLLLRREGDRWTQEQRNVLPDGVRDSLAKHNILEFKYTESLNESAIIQSLAYDHFYKQANNLSQKNVSTFILSAKTPSKHIIEEGGYKLSKHKGVYHSKKMLYRLITLLVLNDLSDEPHNAFVKCFASRKKEKKKAYKLIYQTFYKKLSSKLKLFIAGLAKIMDQRNWGEDEMNLEVTPEDIIEFGEKVGEAYLLSLKPEERLVGLKPEERLVGLKPEERLVGLKPEERLVGLKPEERLVGLKPEERLVGLKPEERLVGLKPEERLVGLKLEERLIGLKLEEIEAYLQKLKMQKEAESDDTDKKQTESSQIVNSISDETDTGKTND